MERPCFLLGCIPVVTAGRCSLESFHIFLEWKQHDLGVVKSGKIDIISLVRWRADTINDVRLASANCAKGCAT